MIAAPFARLQSSMRFICRLPLVVDDFRVFARFVDGDAFRLSAQIHHSAIQCLIDAAGNKIESGWIALRPPAFSLRSGKALVIQANPFSGDDAQAAPVFGAQAIRTAGLLVAGIADSINRIGVDRRLYLMRHDCGVTCCPASSGSGSRSVAAVRAFKRTGRANLIAAFAAHRERRDGIPAFLRPRFLPRMPSTGPSRSGGVAEIDP